MNFIRKVYIILSLQLLTTTMFVAAGCFSAGYRMFIKQNMWLMWVCLIISIIIFYVIIYVRSASRKVPLNFLILLIFTLAESYLVSCSTAQYDPQTVFIAAGLTAAVVVALTIYACTSKTDFTMCGGLLFTAFMVLFVGSIFSLFFKSKILRIIISAASVLIFSLYLIYDTQLILGRGELKLTVDDYIYAAMTLYLDIIQIFLHILNTFFIKQV